MPSACIKPGAGSASPRGSRSLMTSAGREGYSQIMMQHSPRMSTNELFSGEQRQSSFWSSAVPKFCAGFLLILALSWAVFCGAVAMLGPYKDTSPYVAADMSQQELQQRQEPV